MGSRAISHESIFLDDQVLSDPDPVRVSSQENVHSKIKSLQVWLLVLFTGNLRQEGTNSGDRQRTGQSFPAFSTNI
uniref:Uncharacterized protein n=1 Tax=Xiphophorus couchianus TaxID=32473 RepID=A0A3B5MN18_9TELE